MHNILKAPMPYFGGKSRIASAVWERFGTVTNYVEPFFGSGAVLLARPQVHGTETVNDINAWLCNFWRALQADPDGVAFYADWPVSEVDLSARGDWLFYRPGVADFVDRLRGDPDFFDLKSAGWWIWGHSCWIGAGWGPRDAGMGVHRQLPHLGDAGRGVQRKLPHLGDAGEADPAAATAAPTARGQALRAYLRALAERLRLVRVCCGDWRRVCGPTPTVGQGLTAMFFDPPYGVADRDTCYGMDDDRSLAAAVRAQCLAWAGEPRLRIALCGYEGEHDLPASWECLAWKARGGYGGQGTGSNANARRERVWFSPSCQRDFGLFDRVIAPQESEAV